MRICRRRLRGIVEPDSLGDTVARASGDQFRGRRRRGRGGASAPSTFLGPYMSTDLVRGHLGSRSLAVWLKVTRSLLRLQHYPPSAPLVFEGVASPAR